MIKLLIVLHTCILFMLSAIVWSLIPFFSYETRSTNNFCSVIHASRDVCIILSYLFEHFKLFFVSNFHLVIFCFVFGITDICNLSVFIELAPKIGI